MRTSKTRKWLIIRTFAVMVNLITFFLQLAIICSFVSCGVNKQNTKPSTCNKSFTDSVIIEQEQEITLIFGGDIMMHYSQIVAAKTKNGNYDFSGCFKHIKSYWEGADAVILNLETTLTDSNYSGYPMFAAPYQLAENLKASGVTHIVTANNHTCDKWATGIKKTIHYLDKAGLHHTGSFIDSTSYKKQMPLFIEKGDFKVALLNYTYGTNGMPIPRGQIVPQIDTAVMKREIMKAHAYGATNIITFIHFGIEYQSKQSKKQEKLAQWLHEKGVDIIIGSHPHVVQPIKYYVKNGRISGVTVYSLGNLISNQRKTKTNGGINVKVKITRKGDNSAYKMRYKSWYVDRRELGESPRYILVNEEIENYHFVNKSDSLAAQHFFTETRILLGSVLSE